MCKEALQYCGAENLVHDSEHMIHAEVFIDMKTSVMRCAIVIAIIARYIIYR